MSFAKLGSQYTVNATVAGDQDRSSVIQLLNGDIVVAWTDTNGAAINVRGQILNADGVTRDGSEFMLNTTLTGDQFDVALTALGNGGFAAGWTAVPTCPRGRSRRSIYRTTMLSRSRRDQVFSSDRDQDRRAKSTHLALHVTTSIFVTSPSLRISNLDRPSAELDSRSPPNLSSNSDDFNLFAVDRDVSHR